MSKTIELEKYTKVVLREVAERNNTTDDSKLSIVGGPLDQTHLALAWCLKQSLFLLRADNEHIRQYVDGTAPIIPKVFNKDSSLKQECLDQIEKKRVLLYDINFTKYILPYQNKTEYELIQEYTRMNRHSTTPLLFPRHLWAGEDAHPAPPVAQRMNNGLAYPAFTCPRVATFNVADPDTWLDLNRAEFRNCVNKNGWYLQHVDSKGEPFEAASEKARNSVRHITAITNANTLAEITASAKSLGVYPDAKKVHSTNEENHISRLDKQDIKFKKTKNLFLTALGPAFHELIKNFLKVNDFPGALNAINIKYGVINDGSGTNLLDILRTALSDATTYAGIHDVQKAQNVWTSVMTAYINLSYIKDNAVDANRLTMEEIESSLMMEDPDFALTYPAPKYRVLSYMDSRNYFLKAHEYGRLKHKIAKYAVEDITANITSIIKYLLTKEQHMITNPHSYPAEKSSSAFNAASVPSNEEILKLMAFNATGQWVQDFVPQSLYDNDPNSEAVSIPSYSHASDVASGSANYANDLQKYNDSRSSSAGTYVKTYARPCVICSMAGNVTDKNDPNFRETVKNNMKNHFALNCPYLPKLAALQGGVPNHYNWPSHSQCGLPPYPELLALRKRKGPPTTTYPTMSHSDRADKAEKELQALKRKFGVGTASNSSIHSAVGTHFDTVNNPNRKAFVASSLPDVNEDEKEEEQLPDA